MAHTNERDTVMNTEPNRERRARRVANKLGLRVEKSRRSGKYRLTDRMASNVVLVGADWHNGHGVDLEVIEQEIAMRR